MPFIEPLDITTPAGNSAKALGDDAIRQFKRAVVERFEAFYNTGVDPWTWKAGVIPGAALANNAVAAAQLANGAVGSAQLADGAVQTAKLENNAVQTAKIADNAVSGAKLADGAVLTAKMADQAVTKLKLAFAPIQVIGEFEENLPAYSPLAVNTSHTDTQNVPGAQLGDYVIGTPKTADSGGYDATVQAHKVSAVDTARIQFLADGGPKNVTVCTWKFVVLRVVP